MPATNRDDFVAGTSDGFLNLNRYNPTSRSFTTLHRFLLGGRVVTVIPWLGRSVQDIGLVAATTEPDRIVFVDVTDEFPYLAVVSEVPLEEDPGEIAFVGNTLTGPWELAVTLPGVDQVVFLAEAADVWSVTATVDSGDEPSALIGVDLDGDSIREGVVAHAGPLSGTLGVFRRQPDATYVLDTVVLPDLTPALVAAHDLDGDGRQELAVAGSQAPAVVIYATDTDELVEINRITLTVPAQSLHLFDLGGGTTGLFAANEDRGLIEFVGLNEWSWTSLDLYYPGCQPHDLFMAELDADNLGDLVTLGGRTESLTVMLGDERPGFSGFSALGLNHRPGSFVADDFDADGWPDLLVAASDETTISLYRGTPAGPLTRSPQDWDLGFIAGDICAANLDADSALEIAVLDLVAGDLVIFDFSLATGFTSRSRTPVGTFPNKLNSGDLDNDTRQDLVVLTRDAEDVRVMYGDGDGGIAEIVTFAYDFPAGRILPLDLNDDGWLDLVASDGLSRIWSKVNQGDRQFAAQAFVNAGSGALDLASADLDGDGDGDLVVANRTEHTLSFFENTGTGGLVRRVGGHALPGAPVGLVLADFSDDGRQDVVVNLQGNGTLGLVVGVADWSYTLPGEFVGGPVVSGMYAGDFNRDSVPDIMVLDTSLLLGLMLLNVEPGQVAVAPTALTSACDGDVLRLRIRPDRPGPWTLELGRSGLWRLAASSGQAFVGDWDFDAGVWLLSLGAEIGEAWLPGAGDRWQARLTVGAGADAEREVWSLDSACLQLSGGSAPRLAWRAVPWPNPFNPQVQARFSLAEAGPVTVAVYDLAGRRQATLAEGEFRAGDHLVRWQGQGPDGPAAAGAYLLRVETTTGVLSRKVMLIK